MAEIEWDAFHNRILVRVLPDEDSLERLARKLSDLIMDRRLEGVSGMTNLSTDDRTLLVVELRRNADAQAVVDEVGKHLPTHE